MAQIVLMTSFSPIRMVVGQKTPVMLDVVIKNKDIKEHLVSLLIKAPYELGFDKVGLMREVVKRIGYVKPNAEKIVTIPIYGRPMLKEGTYVFEVKLFIHKDRYDKIEEVKIEHPTLRVISM